MKKKNENPHQSVLQEYKLQQITRGFVRKTFFFRRVGARVIGTSSDTDVRLQLRNKEKGKQQKAHNP